MKKLPESRNHNPVIIAIGSSAKFKDELYKALISYQNKTWISIPKPSDELKGSDFDIYFFSNQIDDRLLPDINKFGSLVVSSNEYPNKMILHELKGEKKIKLYNTVDEVSSELKNILSNFEKIGNNMNYFDFKNPQTGNIFWEVESPKWGHPGIVTNNVKGRHEFNYIEFDYLSDQLYRIGDREIQHLGYDGFRERLEKNRKGQNIDLIIKNLKLKIAKMKNLKL